MKILNFETFFLGVILILAGVKVFYDGQIKIFYIGDARFLVGSFLFFPGCYITYLNVKKNDS